MQTIAAQTWIIAEGPSSLQGCRPSVLSYTQPVVGTKVRPYDTFEQRWGVVLDRGGVVLHR